MNYSMANYYDNNQNRDSKASASASIELNDLPKFSLDPTLSVRRDKLKDFTQNKIFKPQMMPLQEQFSKEGTELETPDTEYDAKTEHEQYERQQSTGNKMALPMVYSPDGDYAQSMTNHFNKIYAH